MIIPKQFSIGKHKIKTEYVSLITKEFIGRFNIRDFSIKLNTCYSRCMQEEGYIHEVLHAVSLIYGLQLNEHQITVLAEVIYSTILPLENDSLYGNSKKEKK